LNWPGEPFQKGKQEFIVRALFRLGSNLLEKIHYYRYRMRIGDLVARGLVLGKNVTIEYTAYIDDDFPYLVRIGDNCSISNHVRLLAHDGTTFKFTHGHTRLGKVELKDNCFIGERVIILPGVTIGPNVLVVAGSVVNRDIPPNSCVAGVPARFYARFDDLIERHKQRMEERSVFLFSDLNKDEQIEEKIRAAVQDGDAYLRGYLGRYPYTLNSD
jgi:acetyltransferase-like isoleucine patch superfamily enzyme